MSEKQDTKSGRTPWHLWVLGILALIWNGTGAMDYVMTQAKFEPYMSQFTPEQLEYFYGIPAWAVATWATAVWTGVLGALMLLFKKRLAFPTFVTSLIALVITSIHTYGLSNGMEVMGGAISLIFTAVIFLSTVALVIYARVMQKRGVLT